MRRNKKPDCIRILIRPGFSQQMLIPAAMFRDHRLRFKLAIGPSVPGVGFGRRPFSYFDARRGGEASGGKQNAPPRHGERVSPIEGVGFDKPKPRMDGRGFAIGARQNKPRKMLGANLRG